MLQTMTDLKKTSQSLARQSRYLAVQYELKCLEQGLEDHLTPILTQIEKVEKDLKTIEFGLKMSLAHRNSAGSAAEIRRKVTEDDAEISTKKRRLKRLQSRAIWLKKAWENVAGPKRYELEKIRATLGPDDNLLRDCEIRFQQAEPPPCPTVKQDP